MGQVLTTKDLVKGRPHMYYCTMKVWLSCSVFQNPEDPGALWITWQVRTGSLYRCSKVHKIAVVMFCLNCHAEESAILLVKIIIIK